MPSPAPGDSASTTDRKFPCPSCGAKLDFDPTRRALACPYCGTAQPIVEAEGEVRERDWDEYWRNAEAAEATIAGRSSEVQCRACAAVVLLEDKLVTDKCPYCGDDLENKPVSAHSMIVPEGILPFKVDQKKAVAAFRAWVESRWFAPSDLKKMANLGQLNGIYVPYWTFDSQTATHYTGERGDNYQETETYTEMETTTSTDAQGQTTTSTRPVTKTRTVTKTRWSHARGYVEHPFDDVLICASKSIPVGLIQQLEPWDLPSLEPFQAPFLAGFQTERYSIGLKEGFEKARAIMDGHIRVLCCQDIGGDHQRLHSVNTDHHQISFKHNLHPVWYAPYRYREKVYQIAVNARTGEVVGTRPYSYWKPFLIVLAVLGTIGAIAGIAALVGAVMK